MINTYEAGTFYEDTSASEKPASYRITYKRGFCLDGGQIAALIVVVLGAVLLVVAGVNALAQWRYESACTQIVTGTVVGTSTSHHYTGSKYDHPRDYLNVRYSYTYEGKTYYTDETIAVYKSPTKKEGDTRGFYIDPKNPNNTRFPDQIDSEGDMFGMICLGVGTALVLVGGMIFFLKKHFDV